MKDLMSHTCLPSFIRLPRWSLYALAVTATLAALLLFPAMGFTSLAQPAPILLLVPILFCSYLGGLGPGLVSTMLAAMGSAYIIMPPQYSFFIFRPVDRLRLATLVVNGILVCCVSEALHRARRRAEIVSLEHIRDREDIARLNQELHKHKENLEELVSERTADLERMNTQLSGEIEERKRTAGALGDSEARYRALFENSMDAIFLTLPDGRVKSANKAAREMFGMSEEEMVRAGREGIIDTTEPRFATALEERSRAGKIFCELTCIRKNGERFPAETTSFLYNQGRDAIVILHDITSRKLAEDALRNYARRLIEMEEDLRRKLSSELHDEIGRDLTALGINHAIIGELLSPESKMQVGNRINDTGRLIEDISRNVRNIMNSLRPPMLDDYGLSAALRWYGDLFARRTGISVSLQIDENFPGLAPEKELTLFRIAQEALTNVSKHSGARNVAIRLGAIGGKLCLSIIDDGRGFVHEKASRLPDFSGRGLIIMHERAELFGGSFRVDSVPGGGTTVSVEIRED